MITYQSQILFDRNIVIEVFFFDRLANEAQTRETAAGQLEDRSVGEAQNIE